MKIDIDCKALSRLLSDSQDLAPSEADRARVRWHLLACSHCRSVEEQMAFLRRALQGLGRHDGAARP